VIESKTPVYTHKFTINVIRGMPFCFHIICGSLGLVGSPLFVLETHFMLGTYRPARLPAA
jgi:hypothetical protein